MPRGKPDPSPRRPPQASHWSRLWSWLQSDRPAGFALGRGRFVELVPFAGLLAFLGGLSVALGYRTRAGAWLLILYLVPVTFVMHRYWAISDPAAARMEYVQFMKNLSLLGGALLLACFGGGPFSLDAAAAGPPSTPHGRMPPRP